MRIVCFILSLWIGSDVLAQSSYTIKGKVVDSSGNPIAGLTVRIKAGTGADSLTRSTDALGQFLFTKFSKSRFSLQITSVGFKSYQSDYFFAAAQRSIDIGTLVLQVEINVLEGVTVQARTPAVVFKEDTIEYKADSFAVRKNADVEELLKKLPGIQVDKDGTVIAQGKIVSKIRVNGKDFFEGNSRTATKNLPADIVDKIQVIDDYGESGNFTGFKSSEPEKIINIQLKKEKSGGYFIRLQAGYGSKRRYDVTNSLNHFTDSRQMSVYTNHNNTGNGTLIQSGTASFSGSLSDLIRLNNQMVEKVGGAAVTSALMTNQDIGYLYAVPAINTGISRNASYGVRFSNSGHTRFNYYGSYVYYNIHNDLSAHTGGLQYFAASALNEDQTLNKRAGYEGHRVFANMEYKPDSSVSISLFPTVTLGKQQADRQLEKINRLGNTVISQGLDTAATQANNNQYSLRAIGKIRFKRTASALFLETVASTGQSDDEQDTRYVFGAGQLTHAQQQVNTAIETTSWDNKAIYVVPFAGRGRTEFTYGYKTTRSSSDRQTYLFDGSRYVLDERYSSFFLSVTNQHTGAVHLKYPLGKLETTVGLGIQDNNFVRKQAGTKVFDQHTVNLLPLVQLNYPFSKTRFLMFKYSGVVQPPNPTQTLPVADTANPFFVFTGNPFLSPEFRNSGAVSYYNFDYMKGRLLLVGLSYTKVFNKIIPTVELSPQGKTLQSLTNTDKNQDIGLFYNISSPFANKKFELTLSGNLLFSRYAFYDKTIAVVNTYSYQQVIEGVYNPSWGDLRLGLSARRDQFSLQGQLATASDYLFYQHTTINIDPLRIGIDWGLIYNKGYFLPYDKWRWMSNGYAEWNFFRKWTIRLDGVDIWNSTPRTVSRLKSSNVIQDNRYNVIGRYVLLSIRLQLSRFGPGK